MPLTIDELVDTAPVAEWLINNLLISGQYMLITGGTGVGKSQLALQLGMCIGAPMGWLMFDIPVVKNVCYVSVEMSHAEVAWFAKEMRNGINTQGLNFRILPIGETISILTEDGKNFYRRLVEDFDVIIIDTLGASTHTTLSDEEAARGIVDFFNELKAGGTTLIVVHHDSKHNGSSARTEDAYGSRLFVDRASTVLRLSKLGDQEAGIKLDFSKIRLAPEPQALKLQRTENLWYVTSEFESKQVVKGLPGGTKQSQPKPGVERSLY